MIQIETFQAGETRLATKYRYFMPNTINTVWNWNNPLINKLLEEASFQLGQLNSYTQLVPNVDLLVYTSKNKEAVLSSRIEGTQTSIDEAFLHEEDINPEGINDWQEVQNYINALNQAIVDLENLPLSSRLILQTHKILMQGVRGERKTPGEYRHSQNWIGGRSLDDAVFIPPHQDHLNLLMGDLENFIHNDSLGIPLLIKTAIIHYQFETIHPFLDGNGRIGRLLIPLFLIEKKILTKPLLYLSAYFEEDRNLYYDNLTRVRTHNDIAQWIKYFLVGIAQISHKAVETLSKILEMKLDTENLIRKEFGKRINVAFLLYNSLFENPITSIKEVEKICNLSPKAAGDLVRLFREKSILEKYKPLYSRNQKFIYKKYLDLFR